MDGVREKRELSGENAPRDAQVIASILKSMGVRQYDERVVPMLMELLHRYVAETLEDAKSYSDFAARANGDSIEVDDIKLAIQGRVGVAFPQLPSRELLAQLARERNSQPLPPIDNARPGVQLPPEADQLTSINYQIRTGGAKRSSTSAAAANKQVRFAAPAQPRTTKAAAAPVPPTTTAIASPAVGVGVGASKTSSDDQVASTMAPAGSAVQQTTQPMEIDAGSSAPSVPPASAAVGGSPSVPAASAPGVAAAANAAATAGSSPVTLGETAQKTTAPAATTTAPAPGAPSAGAAATASVGAAEGSKEEKKSN